MSNSSLISYTQISPNRQKVCLIGYQGKISDQMLHLGTKDSYGTEQLQITLGPEWTGLTITATFVTPAGSTRVLVPQDGLLTVPPEAMATALSHRSPGRIVFAGVDDGVQRVTANVLYLVTDHAPVEGEDSHPTPSEFAQFVAQVKDDAAAAAASEQAAAASARSAGQSEAQAAESARQAAQSEQAAAQSADSAAESAHLAQQGAANAGWLYVEGVDGILYLVRSDNAPEDFVLQDNGKGVLEAVYG